MSEWRSNMDHQSKVYVVVPTSKESSSIVEYLIEPAILASNMNMVLGNDERFSTNIQSLSESDVVIADLTGVDAGVYYELGISHAFNKFTILISQSFDDVPKPLKGYQIIIYSTRFDKATDLTTSIRKALLKYSLNGSNGNPITDFVINSQSETNADKRILSQDKQLVLSSAVDHLVENFKLDPLNDLQAASTRIAAYTMDFGQKLNQRTAELEVISRTMGSGNYSKARRVLRNASDDIMLFASQLHSERENMTLGTDFIVASIDYFAKFVNYVSEGDSNVFQFKIMIRQLDKSLDEALPSLIFLREQLTDNTTDQKELRYSSKRAVNEVNFLIDTFINIQSSCKRAYLVIDTREEPNP
jgi:hypothetical protein